jgi:hypothetical protein
MARVFLSYATTDRVFAERLASSLTLLGYIVWLDRWEITVGDVLPERIASGIATSDLVVVVLSPAAVQSVWVEREIQMAVFEEIGQRRMRVLPALIADCSVPLLLRSKYLADFRAGFDVGLAQLAVALDKVRTAYSLPLPAPAALPAITSSYPLSRDGGNGYTDGMGYKAPQLSEVTVELGLPYVGTISGKWKPDETEQRAAWELYVELVTRVSVAALQPDEGLLRESLSSLYAIFHNTRALLRSYGPSLARPAHDSDVSFGVLALHILNYVLRPVLATWHPLLLDYEYTREETISAFEHERRWEKAGELRQALSSTRIILIDYANILAQVAGVPELPGK